MSEREDEANSAVMMAYHNEVNSENGHQVPSHANEESLPKRNERPSSRNVPPALHSVVLDPLNATRAIRMRDPSELIQTLAQSEVSLLPMTRSDATVAVEEKEDSSEELPTHKDESFLDTSDPVNLPAAEGLPSGSTVGAEEKKNSSEETSSELCYHQERASLNTQDPVNLPTAEGGSDDDAYETLWADIVSLRERDPEDVLAEISACAVDLNSVQEHTGDQRNYWLYQQEELGTWNLEQDLVGYPGKMKLDHHNPSICYCSWWSAEGDTILLDPLVSAQLHVAADRERLAKPPDTRDSTADDPAYCEICWPRMLKFISGKLCRPCYRQLDDMLCPTAKERLLKVEEAWLACGLLDDEHQHIGISCFYDGDAVA